MVYKILFLETLLIAGMLYLRFKPDDAGQATPAPETPQVEPITPIPPPAVSPLPAPKYERVQPEAGELVFPVQNHGIDDIISVFGDKRGKSRLHQGIDIKAPRGTAVVATTDGFVERIKEGGNGGKQLYLRDGAGRLYYYAHLDDWSVAEFDAIKAGTVLGTVGDSGNASGTTPHLHFEVLLGKKKKAVDPMQFWDAK